MNTGDTAHTDQQSSSVAFLHAMTSSSTDHRHHTAQLELQDEEEEEEEEEQEPVPFLKVPAGMLARLLYPNPVCLLSSWDWSSSLPRCNVMTISWLTATDNHGGFFCSMNERRYSAKLVQQTKQFVLNVPVHGMEQLIRRIGGCSGTNVDKFQQLQLQTCLLHHGGVHPFQQQQQQQSNGGDECGATQSKQAAEHVQEEKEPQCSSEEVTHRRHKVRAVACSEWPPLAIGGATVAHILCECESIQSVRGHLHIVGKMKEGWVHPGYWNGKQFFNQQQYPPLLSFLGSAKFARMEYEDS